MWGVRILLALAYPALIPVLQGRDEEDISLLMPSYSQKEITSRVRDVVRDADRQERPNLTCPLPGDQVAAEGSHPQPAAAGVPLCGGLGRGVVMHTSEQTPTPSRIA